MGHRVVVSLIVSFCVWFLPVAARGEEVPPTAFPAGTFALTLQADYAHSFQLSRAKIGSLAVGGGYYFIDNIAATIGVAGYSVEQSGPDSAIAEVSLGIRHHLVASGRWSLYIDALGGLSYATARTPTGGTNFNFTVQTGPGVTYKLSERTYLMGGVRYWHLSNGRREGPARNPSINALEGYLGILVELE